MIFIDLHEKKIYSYFIYNVKLLRNILKNLKFESYYVRIPNDIKKESDPKNSKSSKDSKDSKSSENSSKSKDSIISNEDLSNIFYKTNINCIYNENFFPIISEENYKKRFKQTIEYLKDLSIEAYKYYNEYSNNKFYYFNEYEDICEKFIEYLDGDYSQVLYLFGPKGNSKSTFLLYCINYFKERGTDFRTLYFNIRFLRDKNFYEIKNILSHELLYLFENEKEMEEIAKKKIFHLIYGNDIFELIYSFISNLIKALNIDIKSDRKIIFILDNIFCNNEEKDNLIKIINLTNSCFKQNKFILSGKGAFFNKKFIELFKNGYYENLGINLKENFFILNINFDTIKKIFNNTNKTNEKLYPLYAISETEKYYNEIKTLEEKEIIKSKNMKILWFKFHYII